MEPANAVHRNKIALIRRIENFMAVLLETSGPNSKRRNQPDRCPSTSEVVPCGQGAGPRAIPSLGRSEYERIPFLWFRRTIRVVVLARIDVETRLLRGLLRYGRPPPIAVLQVTHSRGARPMEIL